MEALGRISARHLRVRAVRLSAGHADTKPDADADSDADAHAHSHSHVHRNLYADWGVVSNTVQYSDAHSICDARSKYGNPASTWQPANADARCCTARFDTAAGGWSCGAADRVRGYRDHADRHFYSQRSPLMSAGLDKYG